MTPVLDSALMRSSDAPSSWKPDAAKKSAGRGGERPSSAVSRRGGAPRNCCLPSGLPCCPGPWGRSLRFHRGSWPLRRPRPPPWLEALCSDLRHDNMEELWLRLGGAGQECCLAIRLTDHVPTCPAEPKHAYLELEHDTAKDSGLLCSGTGCKLPTRGRTSTESPQMPMLIRSPYEYYYPG